MNKIEILIIDDESSDKSVEICDEFATKDNRVKMFHIKNQGTAHARNYGIKKYRENI